MLRADKNSKVDLKQFAAIKILIEYLIKIDKNRFVHLDVFERYSQKNSFHRILRWWWWKLSLFFNLYSRCKSKHLLYSCMLSINQWVWVCTFLLFSVCFFFLSSVHFHSPEKKNVLYFSFCFCYTFFSVVVLQFYNFTQKIRDHTQTTKYFLLWLCMRRRLQ